MGAAKGGYPEHGEIQTVHVPARRDARARQRRGG